MGGNLKLIDKGKNSQALEFATNDLVRRTLVDIKEVAKKGDQKTLNLLVNSGISINSKGTIFGDSPIHNVTKKFNIIF